MREQRAWAEGACSMPALAVQGQGEQATHACLLATYTFACCTEIAGAHLSSGPTCSLSCLALPAAPTWSFPPACHPAGRPCMPATQKVHADQQAVRLTTLSTHLNPLLSPPTHLHDSPLKQLRVVAPHILQ